MALTREKVQAEMQKGAVVVNVLDEKAFSDLHIAGSMNIPLKSKSDGEFAKEVDQKVGKDRMIITHCSNINCTAGPRAAVILKSLGFKAEDYPGGIEDWFNAGLPVLGKKSLTHAS